MTRRRLLVALTIVLTPLGLAPTAVGQPERPARVEVRVANAAFSPNGDGVQDQARIRYRLDRPARVTVLVRRGGETVATLVRGHQQRGRHTVPWDGKRNGKVVADGRYRVTVRSIAAGRTSVAHRTLVVKARPDIVGDGTIAMSSRTVYPRTTVIHDVVVGNLIPDYAVLDVKGPIGIPAPNEYSPEEKALARLRSQVLDSSGRVIDSTPVEPATTGLDLSLDDCAQSCGRFTWDGRDRNGTRVPTGTYRLRVVHGRDVAGNPRLLAPAVSVRVSRTKLVPETTTVTLAAAAATRQDDYDGGCNGCGEDRCSSLPSERFPGGLSYRSIEINPTWGPTLCRVHDRFTLPTTGRRTPYDTFRVRAVGGPTVPGTASNVRLGQAWSGHSHWYPTAGADAIVSTPVLAIAANTEPNRTMFVMPIGWDVYVADGNSYDIASFTVEQTRYVPAP